MISSSRLLYLLPKAMEIQPSHFRRITFFSPTIAWFSSETTKLATSIFSSWSSQAILSRTTWMHHSLTRSRDSLVWLLRISLASRRQMSLICSLEDVAVTTSTIAQKLSSSPRSGSKLSRPISPLSRQKCSTKRICMRYRHAITRNSWAAQKVKLEQLTDLLSSRRRTQWRLSDKRQSP